MITIIQNGCLKYFSTYNKLDADDKFVNGDSIRFLLKSVASLQNGNLMPSDTQSDIEIEVTSDIRQDLCSSSTLVTTCQSMAIAVQLFSRRIFCCLKGTSLAERSERVPASLTKMPSRQFALSVYVVHSSCCQ